MATPSTMTVTTVNGTPTTYLALTAEWPYTSACAGQIWYDSKLPITEAYNPSLNGVWYDSYQTWYPQTECLPPFITHLHTTPDSIIPTLDRTALGSLVCPQSWSQVYSTWDSVLGGEMGCCPPDYTMASLTHREFSGGYYTTSYAGCRSPVTSGQVFTAAPAYYDDFPGAATSGLSIITCTTDGSIDGWLLRASYSPVVDDKGPTTDPTARPTSSSDLKQSPIYSGLSVGAKAGIGVAVALVVLWACAAFGILLIYRRHRKSQHQNAYKTQPSRGIPQANVGSQWSDFQDGRLSNGHQMHQELASGHQLHPELAGGHHMHEELAGERQFRQELVGEHQFHQELANEPPLLHELQNKERS